MSSPSTVYLITGANRPRGVGTITFLLDAFVYATARDPSKAPALDELKKKYPSRLAIVKWVAADVEGNKALAKEIEERHGRVDTVIGNASLLAGNNRVNDVLVSDLEDHFKANVLGPVVLFQALYNLLKKSKQPRFVPISSLVGSISEPTISLDMRNTPYASSKATLNWITRKIHYENEWLITFPLSPGGVDTDMFDYSKETDASGALQAVIQTYGEFPTADKVAVLLLNIIDESTREKDGGQFINVDGSRASW
ncbi:Norsolorinic acid ketoreductase [Psilocybe cubensis]|uniref:Norsolorinic acid ketoreductase n=1 Tax=Psilocybe cubensis TaxID=181762 RepID=A0ACB8HA87_PSICU|nr:Norsolorinic acid ketoreductase [Psilocybe cubensis]KAH9484734.1 Norsolorinic acid ketoreductase [Psilocybe cubensis]